MPLDVEVVKGELTADEALARVGGFVGMHPVSPHEFLPIGEIELPDAPTYRLLGVDTGAEFLDVTPEDALPRIFERGRSPLTIDEGIAVVLHSPGVLQETAFSLLGSRRGDRRVPALWLSGGRPRLGWCWAGAPHPWLGSASCAGRVEA